MSFVIIKRYGLDGEDAMTLEEVGKLLHVTRERIRQIEHRAIARLQKNGAFNALFKIFA